MSKKEELKDAEAKKETEVLEPEGKDTEETQGKQSDVPTEKEDTDTKEAQKEVQASQEEPQGTDWKAQAKKWEKRAKANAEKAKQFDAQDAEVETVEQLKAQLEDARAQIERANVLATVSEETGVPAKLLRGNTEEELRELAEGILEFAKSQVSYPTDKGAGATSTGTSKENIEKIKDPVARVKARANNMELYK